MKSNDDIPDDEMMLAEAIAATHRRGLSWCQGAIFQDDNGFEVCGRSPTTSTASCCAVGGLILAGYTDLNSLLEARVVDGNDFSERWFCTEGDNGESLGWAYRCAMERGF